MKITILGSSSFVSSPDRFGPSFLVETEDKKMLIDTGSGSQIRLAQLGISLKELNCIFITHFHPDHTTDLASFYVRFVQIVSKEPDYKDKLVIYGPKGIKEFIENILKISELGMLIGKPGPRVEEFKELDGKSIKITAFKTQHMGAISQGYRFGANGKTAVFTGDTAEYPGIANDFKNADLLFVDSSKNKEEPTDAHLNTSLIAKICTNANVKKVILCHILGYNSKKDLAAEVKQKFNGEVIQAKDLMTFEL